MDLAGSYIRAPDLKVLATIDAAVVLGSTVNLGCVFVVFSWKGRATASNIAFLFLVITVQLSSI